MGIKEPIKIYTQKDIDEAMHQGYKVAQEMSLKIINELKQKIKELEHEQKI